MKFLFMILGMTASAEEIHLNQYETNHQWYKTPNIIICNDSPVTINEVSQAKIEWEKSGRQLGKVIKSNHSCKEKYVKGSILIMGDRDDLDASQNHAITIRWYKGGSDRKIIESAFIEIDFDIKGMEKTKRKKLLTHELGHALGYRHNKIKNDIMNKDIMH